MVNSWQKASIMTIWRGFSKKHHKKRVCHKPHPIRPEGAEALSPGQRPGFQNRYNKVRPERAKAFNFKAFALSGRPCFCQHYPGRCPGLRAFGLSARPRLPLFRLVALHLFNNGTSCPPGTLSTGMLEADYYKVFP